MKNILVYLPVARFIQTGERTDGFMQLPKKARRKAEGARNVLLLAQMALVCENYEEGRQYDRCQITGVGCLPDTFNMFSLQPLQVAGPKAEPAGVPTHDFIDLKIARFITAAEAERHDSEDSEHSGYWIVRHCSEGFDQMLFRAETGLYNAAFSFDQLLAIKKQLATSKTEAALIEYSVITVQ